MSSNAGDTMKGTRFYNGVLGGLLACTLLFSAHAYADSDDHERARQLLAEGKIMPLRTVLEKVEKEFGGQVVKIEFEHEDDHDDDDDDKGKSRWLYEIKLVQDSGQMLKLVIDAENGSILKKKGKKVYKNRQEND